MRVELSANSLLTLRDLDQPSIIYVYIRIYTHIYTYICWASGVSIPVSLSRRLALARAPPRFTKSTTQLRNERRSCGLTNTPHAPTKMATHSGSKTPLRPSPQRNPFRPPPSFFSAEYQTAHMDIPPSKPTTMSEPGTPMQPIYPRCSMCGIKAVKPPIEMCLKCKFLILVLVILLVYIVLTISKKNRYHQHPPRLSSKAEARRNSSSSSSSCSDQGIQQTSHRQAAASAPARGFREASAASP